MINAYKKVITVDFDGTLVFNRYPFIENPNINLINFIKNNRDKYIFILYTCRNGKQLDYAIKYLKDEFDLEFDYINENTRDNIYRFGDTRKILADYYIDDRNVLLTNFFDILGK